MKKGFFVTLNTRALLLSVFLMIVFCGKSQIITEGFEESAWIATTASYGSSTLTVSNTTSSTNGATGTGTFVWQMAKYSITSSAATNSALGIKSGTKSWGATSTSSYIITPGLSGNYMLTFWTVRAGNSSGSINVYAGSASTLGSTTSKYNTAKFGSYSNIGTNASGNSLSSYTFTAASSAGMVYLLYTTGGSSTYIDDITITPIVSTNLPIGGFDFSAQTGGTNNFGSGSLAASLTGSNITMGNLTRASGVGTTGTGAARGVGGTNFNSASAATGITANAYFTFTVKSNTGYNLSLSSLSSLDYRRSTTGPTNIAIQYSLDGTNFTDIATKSLSSPFNAQIEGGPLDLSSISELQNVPASTTITFRLVPYGASASTGTFYFYDFLNNSGEDLTINGITTVAAVPDIALADNSGGQVAAGNITKNTTNNIIYNFQLGVTTANATLNSVAFATTNSASDVSNFKLYYASTNSFGSASQIGTSITTGLGTGTHTFSSLTQVINSGATGYFWIVSDVPSGATSGNTIAVTAITTSDITFASGNKTGSTTGGGTQTIIAAPTVTTNAATNITTTDADLSGTVNANASATTGNIQFEYGTTTGYGTSVTTTPSSASGTSGTSVTATAISSGTLVPNTLYHYRLNATNGVGTTNSTDATFTTLSLAPSISGGNETSAQTSAASTSFTAYWSAPASQGAATYTYTIEVDDDNTFGSITATYTGIASGTLTQAVTGLSSGVTYYYRVKAVNATGSSAWSNTSAGITTTSTPVVVLADNGTIGAANISELVNNNILSSFSINVTSANATLTGLAFNFTNSGLVSTDIVNYKLYYSATNSFPGGAALATVTTGLATSPINFSSFSQTINAGNTGYFWVTTDVATTAVAAHSITAAALAVGDLTFSGSVSSSGSTSAQGTQTIITRGVVSTTAASSITATGANSGGNVTSDGGSSITERGIVYSTSANPTTSDTKVIDGATTTGSFTSSISGLSNGTTYHVRAYVINSIGTSYGSDVSFTTQNIATLTTTAASSITGTSANSGGNISSDGGSTLSERGVVYSTSANPTTSDTKVIDGATTTGAYASAISGLSPLTTYHVRAYAINSIGTAYGNDISFTTISSEPTVQSSAVNFSGIGLTSMTINFTAGDGTNRIVLVKSGSAVNSNPVVAVSYSTSTIFGSGSQIGTGNYVVYNGTGSSVTITGLTPGTIYHVAVYEFNGSGGTENYYLTTPATGNQATSNANYHSITSGNWSSAATWEYYDGSSWVAAVSAPNSTSGTINIQNGHTVTVDVSVSADELTIDAGGQITVAASQTLTIADGTGTDLTIASGATLKNQGTITNNGQISVTGTYEHAFDGGTVPTATWNSGSTCLVTGIVNSTTIGGCN